MLFQGQESMSRRPFLYFADHGAELGARVAGGRRSFLRQFPSLAAPEAQERIADPTAMETFLGCKLDPQERARSGEAVALHRDLLSLRRSEAAFRRQRADLMHGVVLGQDALALRFLGGGREGGGREGGG